LLILPLLALLGAACGPAETPAPPVESDQAEAADCFFTPSNAAVPVELATEPDGSLVAAVPAQSFVAEARSGEWVLVAAADPVEQGWVPVSQGSFSGNCDAVEILPTLEPVVAAAPTATPNTCRITVHVATSVYRQPNFDEPVGTLAAEQVIEGLVHTADGWYGFDPGVAQADARGLDRLHWLPILDPTAPIQTLTAACGAVPDVVYP
jgi:hypothetical protein